MNYVSPLLLMIAEPTSSTAGILPSYNLSCAEIALL